MRSRLEILDRLSNTYYYFFLFLNIFIFLLKFPSPIHKIPAHLIYIILFIEVVELQEFFRSFQRKPVKVSYLHDKVEDKFLLYFHSSHKVVHLANDIVNFTLVNHFFTLYFLVCCYLTYLMVIGWI